MCLVQPPHDPLSFPPSTCFVCGEVLGAEPGAAHSADKDSSITELCPQPPPWTLSKMGMTLMRLWIGGTEPRTEGEAGFLNQHRGGGRCSFQTLCVEEITFSVVWACLQPWACVCSWQNPNCYSSQEALAKCRAEWWNRGCALWSTAEPEPWLWYLLLGDLWQVT